MTTDFHPLTARVAQAIENRAGHYPSTRHESYRELTASIDAFYEGLIEAYPSVTISVPEDIDTQLSAMLQRGIMIAGAAKSGTSLLRNLLDDHPQIIALPTQGAMMGLQRRSSRGVPNEELHPRIFKRVLYSLISHDLGGGPNWLLSRGEPAHEPYLQFVALTYQKFLKGPDTPVAFFQASIYALTYVYLMQNPGHPIPTHWLEQSPGGLREADALAHNFPDIYLLYGVRDPRAVFASTKYRHLGKYQNFDIHHHADYVRRELLLTQEVMTSDLIKNRRLTHYETLVSHPEDTLNETLDFLGLPFHENTLVPTVLGVPVQANTAYKDARKAQVFTGSIDRWRERLTEAEITFTNRLFRTPATLGDYDLPPVSHADYIRAVFALKKQYTDEGLKFSILRGLRQGFFPPA